MTLYEAVNGWTGESYVRAYVWAHDENEALLLAAASFKANAPHGDDGSYWTSLVVMKLLDSGDAPFATLPSDDGWKVMDDGH